MASNGSNVEYSVSGGEAAGSSLSENVLSGGISNSVTCSSTHAPSAPHPQSSNHHQLPAPNIYPQTSMPLNSHPSCHDSQMQAHFNKYSVSIKPAQSTGQSTPTRMESRSPTGSSSKPQPHHDTQSRNLSTTHRLNTSPNGIPLEFVDDKNSVQRRASEESNASSTDSKLDGYNSCRRDSGLGVDRRDSVLSNRRDSVLSTFSAGGRRDSALGLESHRNSLNRDTTSSPLYKLSPPTGSTVPAIKRILKSEPLHEDPSNPHDHQKRSSKSSTSSPSRSSLPSLCRQEAITSPRKAVIGAHHRPPMQQQKTSMGPNEPIGETYGVECGTLKGVLYIRKFICPGINARCIRLTGHVENVGLPNDGGILMETRDGLITPKELVNRGGKDSLKDWKRAIKINGTNLRKLIETGKIDYYHHRFHCSNQCRSNKTDYNSFKSASFDAPADSNPSMGDVERAATLSLENRGQIVGLRRMSGSCGTLQSSNSLPLDRGNSCDDSLNRRMSRHSTLSFLDPPLGDHIDTDINCPRNGGADGLACSAPLLHHTVSNFDNFSQVGPSRSYSHLPQPMFEPVTIKTQDSGSSGMLADAVDISQRRDRVYRQFEQSNGRQDSETLVKNQNYWEKIRENGPVANIQRMIHTRVEDLVSCLNKDSGQMSCQETNTGRTQARISAPVALALTNLVSSLNLNSELREVRENCKSSMEHQEKMSELRVRSLEEEVYREKQRQADMKRRRESLGSMQESGLLKSAYSYQNITQHSSPPQYQPTFPKYTSNNIQQQASQIPTSYSRSQPSTSHSSPTQIGAQTKRLKLQTSRNMYDTTP